MDSNEFAEIEQSIAAATSPTTAPTTSATTSATKGKSGWSMPTSIQGWIDKALDWKIYGLVFLLPLFFLPFTSEVIDLNKQALLLVGMFAISLLYIGRSLIHHSVEVRPHMAYAGIGGVVVAWIAAAAMSRYPYQSIFGLEGQQFMSVVSVVAFALFALITANHFTDKRLSNAINALLVSGAGVVIIGMLQLFGVNVFPIDFTQTTSFNTVGMTSMWATFNAIVLVLAVARILQLSSDVKSNKLMLGGLTLLSLVEVASLIIVDDLYIWGALIIGFVSLIGLLLAKLPKEQRLSWLALPSVLIVVSLAMTLVNVRIVTTPVEAFPSLKTSAEITSATLKESPLFGFGPGNFVMSYEKFRPAEINTVDMMGFWNARFDQSSSTLLSKVSSTGLLGLLAMLALGLMLAFRMGSTLHKRGFDEQYMLFAGVSSALLVTMVFQAVRPSNMTLSFVTWLLIGGALFLTASAPKILAQKGSNHHLVITSVIISLFALTGISGIYLYAAQRYLPDVAYLEALKTDLSISNKLQKGEKVSVDEVKGLVEKMNSAAQQSAIFGQANTGYLRGLSQSLLFYMNRLNLEEKKDDSLVAGTANDAVEIAKQAAAINPHDGRNAYNLALVYETLSSYDPNALKFAAENIEKVIAVEPTNPAIQLELGKVYFEQSIALLTQAQQLPLRDEKGAEITGAREQQAALAKQSDEMVAKSETAFKKAVELKPNYAAAYFQLAVTNIRMEKKEDARTNLDRALQYNLSLSDLAAADPILFYSIGLGYNTIEEPGSAESAFVLAQRAANGNYPLALYQLMQLAKQQERFDQAIQIGEYLLKQEPENKIVQAELESVKQLKAAKEAPAPAPAPEAVPAEPEKK